MLTETNLPLISRESADLDGAVFTAGHVDMLKPVSRKTVA